MFNFRSTRFAGVLLAASALVACEDDVTTEPIDQTVVDIAVANGFATLAQALTAADLVTTLQGDGPFTVFAPTDAAFAALPTGVLDELLDPANVDLLTDILTYHVVSGSVLAADVVTLASATTLNGADVTITVDGANVMINDANVTQTDIQGVNGVVHVIDAVLLPTIIYDVVQQAEAANFSTLVAAVTAADLATTLKGDGPFTVFAPSDAAFEELGMAVSTLIDNPDVLADILTYHVIEADIRAADLMDGTMVETVEGSMVTIDLSDPMDPKVNGASITATDIVTTNGVIHVIDAVLLPELNVFETAVATDMTATLAAAVNAGDLAETLSGTGPFTVFAPINEAFDALGASTVEALLDPDNQAILADVLTYHVIEGDIRAADLMDGAMVETVEGGMVTIDLSDAMDPKVNGASIIATDIVTENGVIHLIDGVLTESMDIVQRAIVTDETATLVAAVTAGDLVTTLQGEGPFTVFAPINAAFEALGTDQLDVLLDPANIDLLQKVLTYHVIEGDIRAADLMDGAMVETVEGGMVTIDLSDAMDPKVNGASIIATDIVTENGVIHLIDGVLTENLNLVDVAVVNGFSTLVELVDQQGLAGALSATDADLTVFAPTNEAFAALQTVPSGDALTDVLTYHVLDAIVAAGDLSDGLVVDNQLLDGSSFTVNISGDDVTITDGAGNTVGVVLTDVMASNGIIHVIDTVLLPAP